MTDLFANRAADWDNRPMPTQISEGVFSAITANVPLTQESVVLDFGAGTGLLAGKLAPLVKSILAVDVSPAMLEQLSQKPELAGKTEIFCQDLVHAPLGRSADLIVSAMAMHHVADTQTLVRALFAHTTPGGHVALADLDTEDGSFHAPGTQGIYHLGFDRMAVEALLREVGFVEVRCTTACTVVREGRSYPIFLVTAQRPADG